MIFKEMLSRKFIKTTSYGCLGTIQTMVIFYVATGDFNMSLLAGAVDLVSKMILYSLHEKVWDNIHFREKTISPQVIWLTGMSGAGKSTIADELIKRLKTFHLPVELLDGDSIREFFPQTGFTFEERVNHIQRVGF